MNKNLFFQKSEIPNSLIEIIPKFLEAMKINHKRGRLKAFH